MKNELRKHFITTDRPYREGTVEVFKQPLNCQNPLQATLTITALGVYEAALNGKKIGDALLTPGYTYYPKDLHYQTYDITELVTGNDILTVYLGQGWYCGRFTYNNETQIYGERAAVSWIIEIKEEGCIIRFCSDDADVSSIASPYEYAGLYDGEVYHAEPIDQQIFPPLRYTGSLPEVLEESDICVRIREKMPVNEVMKSDGRTILDFGQNFAGIIEIDPQKMNGDVIKIRHGELLNKDGSIYTGNLRKAKAEIIYYKGAYEDKYRPRFTYMGFRYVEITLTDYVPGMISAYAIYSDMRRSGYFECDHQKVQKLYENQVWGQKTNYIEIPTDCPQRDERMGYTGDGHVFAETGAYNFDTDAFWNKFLKDIRYSQADNEEGYIAATVPSKPKEKRGFINMLGWGNCITIVPELLYRQFGAERPVRESYESMKRFVEMEIRHMGRRNLWLGLNLGDWLAYGRSTGYLILHNNPVSNAFIINDLRIMSWAADLLGQYDDAKKYAQQLQKTQKAYIKAFIRSDGIMKDDYQGAYVMALSLALSKGELYDKVFANLVKKIRKEGMRTGFFATAHLLPLLTENGQIELAYDLLLQEDCPGWMYQINQGATTTWERWDALKPDGSINDAKMGADNMVSFNHYAFGSVGAFYYKYILGIRPSAPGFAKITIEPHFDERLGSVSGTYFSKAGKIQVEWDPATDILHIVVPSLTEIVLPDGQQSTVDPGEHSFMYRKTIGEDSTK